MSLQSGIASYVITKRHCIVCHYKAASKCRLYHTSSNINKAKFISEYKTKHHEICSLISRPWSRMSFIRRCCASSLCCHVLLNFFPFVHQCEYIFNAPCVYCHFFLNFFLCVHRCDYIFNASCVYCHFLLNSFLFVHRWEYIFIASYFYCHFLLNFFLFVHRCFSRKCIVQEQLHICA